MNYFRNCTCIIQLHLIGTARVAGYFGPGTGSILMSSLQCAGTENDLKSCSYSSSNSCVHAQDAGVMCACP